MLFFFLGVAPVSTTGVVMRRRATTGVDGTREVGFCFFPPMLTTGVVMRRRATQDSL